MRSFPGFSFPPWFALFHLMRVGWVLIHIFLCSVQAVELPNTIIGFQVSTNGMEDLSALLRAHLDRTQFPAMAAAVVRGTNISAASAVGVRKAGEAAAVTLSDKFHIGSCTKSMTALLAVLLEQKQTIHLTNRVADILKDWPIPPAVQGITLRLLLENRSGIGSEPDDKLWLRTFLNPSGSPREQRRRFLLEIIKTPLADTPGTKFIYSNLGYALAGAMMEVAAGQSWETLMQEQIFTPLKLASAGFGPPSLTGEIDQPWGHEWKDGKAAPALPTDNPSAIAPGGAVHLSILDCARYAAFHLAVARGKIEPLKAYCATLYSPPAESSYALGWRIEERSWAGGTALTHTGTNTMFYTVIWIAPEKNFACVLSTNTGDSADKVAALCDPIVAELIEKFVP